MRKNERKEIRGNMKKKDVIIHYDFSSYTRNFIKNTLNYFLKRIFSRQNKRDIN